MACDTHPSYDRVRVSRITDILRWEPRGPMRGVVNDSVSWFVDGQGHPRWVAFSNAPEYRADSIVYRLLVSPMPWMAPSPPTAQQLEGPVIISRPFQMAAGSTVRTVISLMFSDSLGHLLVMDDYLRRMYASGYQRASAPPPPRLSARAMNRGVRLTWDTGAEGAVDSLVPTSLGRPFYGYRLLRAESEEGPFVEIGKWRVDSVLVHEYVDRGAEIGD